MATKFFFIESQLNSKVLDIQSNDQSEGTHVIMYGKKQPPSNNQLWYIDDKGNIRSRLNGFVLDGTGEYVVTNYGNPPKCRMQWFVDGDFIVSRDDRSQVIDIYQGNSEDGARLCVFKRHGGANQRWKIVYV